MSDWGLFVHNSLLANYFICVLKSVPLRVTPSDDLRQVLLGFNLRNLVLLDVVRDLTLLT